MFEIISEKLTNYVCKNDAKSLANLFTNDGTYHDYIYGSFKGRNNIQVMLANYFHRDAEHLFWEMYDHVFNNNMGYAKYRFTFTSKVSDYKGKKVVIPGISFFRIKNGLISEYSESVNGGLAMVQLGINPVKMEKVFIRWVKRSLDDDPNLTILANNQK